MAYFPKKFDVWFPLEPHIFVVHEPPHDCEFRSTNKFDRFEFCIVLDNDTQQIANISSMLCYLLDSDDLEQRDDWTYALDKLIAAVHSYWFAVQHLKQITKMNENEENLWLVKDIFVCIERLVNKKNNWQNIHTKIRIFNPQKHNWIYFVLFSYKDLNV